MKLYIIPLLLLTVVEANAQTDTATIGLEEKIFKKVLNQQFSNLVTGQSKNSIGNFATLETKTPEVSFAGSSISKEGSVFTVKASGGYSDPFFKLFSNSALNTKVSLDVQYHRIGLSNQMLVYYNDSYRDYLNKRAAIRNSYDLKLIAADAAQGKTVLIRKHHVLLSKLTTLYARERAESDETVKDSLDYEIRVVVYQLDSLDNAIETYPPQTTVAQRERTARNIELEEFKQEIKVYGFKFNWWTFGYKIQNDAFRLFDGKFVGTPDQLQKKSFASQEVKAQFSEYNWSSAKNSSYFWLFGLGFTYGHNLSDLTSKELTDITNYAAIPGQLTSTDKYTVYVGTYEKRLKGLRLYGDYYKFLFRNNVLAFHLYPEITVRDKFRPAYNFGIGTLFSFKDEKDETATVNAEIYYNFLDLFDYLDTDDKFFERNDVGLRFSFPIKFKTK